MNKQINFNFDKDLVISRILTDDIYDIIIKDTYKYFNISDKVVCFYNGLIGS